MDCARLIWQRSLSHFWESLWKVWFIQNVIDGILVQDKTIEARFSDLDLLDKRFSENEHKNKFPSNSGVAAKMKTKNPAKNDLALNWWTLTNAMELQGLCLEC